MPPWKPERREGRVSGRAARSPPHELQSIQQWIASGAPEGDAADLPPLPDWNDGWQLGTPDLVVRMAEAYTVPRRRRRRVPHLRHPDSRVASRGTCARSSSGPATRASSTTRTSASIARARRGCSTRAIPSPATSAAWCATRDYPEGQLLGWTPGQAPHAVAGRHAVAPRAGQRPRRAAAPAADREARAAAGRRSACSSPMQPPTRTPVGLRLGSETIDIPAGARGVHRHRPVRLPVDVEVLAVQPHAHNLARRMDGDRDAARRHDALADLDRRLGFPLAGRLSLRARRSCCRRARRSRCATSTTTPPATRATRIIRRRASSGARTRRTRWATCGSRWCRERARDFGDPDRGRRSARRTLKTSPPTRSCCRPIRPTRCATTRSASLYLEARPATTRRSSALPRIAAR